MFNDDRSAAAPGYSKRVGGQYLHECGSGFCCNGCCGCGCKSIGKRSAARAAAQAQAGAENQQLAVEQEATLAPVPVDEMIVPTPTAPPPAPVEDVELPVFNPPPASSAPAAAPDSIPERDAFAASLVNGQADTVVGFYSAGLFALPVVQQPAEDPNFISDQYGTVTQFSKPSQYDSIGLLAHNTLSGSLFFHISMGQEMQLIYGDGRVAGFRVSDIQSYQALSPYDTHSDFVDLNNAGAPVLNHSQLFQRVYTSPGKLVLQTCIDANGEPTWGRIFIVADPL